jgi:hypothetical protein
VRTLLLTTLVLCSATVARAQEVPDLPQPQAQPRPNVVVPILGLALMAGGSFMTYQEATRESDGDPSCATLTGGCTWLGLGGGFMAQAGAAALGYWGWRMGEAAARDDRAAGATRDVSAAKIGGLVVGGAALAAIYAAAVYAGFGAFDCGQSSSRNAPLDEACLSRAKYKPTLVQLGATGALLLAIPAAGYGLGYDATAGARKSQALLLPTLVPGGGGLALTGGF